MKTWQYNLKIPTTYNNKSVRTYLQNYLLLPKHLIFSLRRNHRIKINDKYLPMNFLVHTADKVTLVFKETDFNNANPNVIADDTQKINIIFENDDLLIINKRRGNKTHANQPQEIGASLNFAANYLKPGKPFMVHRLDQQTSGALIIAKNPAVVPPLVDMLKHKNIKRNYLVWVHGSLTNKSGTINLPIGYDPNDKRKRQINGIKSKKAITHYQVITTKNEKTLLKVELETGRTHQIRVHLSAIGHPIVNDPLYDPLAEHNAPMLLHSWQVKFKAPFTYKLIDVEAPLPSEMKA